jgi:hypothetical protein
MSRFALLLPIPDIRVRLFSSSERIARAKSPIVIWERILRAVWGPIPETPMRMEKISRSLP